METIDDRTRPAGGGRRRGRTADVARLARGRLREEPEAAPGADDRDGRRHRHGPVPGRGRTPAARRSGAGGGVSVLRPLRVPDPACPGRIGDASPDLGELRVLCPGVLRRARLVRRRLDVLPELGHDRHRRYHGGGPLHEVLGSIRERTAMGLRARGAGLRGRHEHGGGEVVRGDRVLVLLGQGRRPRPVPRRRRYSRGDRVRRRRPTAGPAPDPRQRRPIASRPAAGSHHRPGRRLRLCGDRAHRDRGRRGAEPARGAAGGDQQRHVADRPVLRRIGGAARAAVALDRLQGRRQSLRHLFRSIGCAGHRHGHEHRGAHRRPVEPQLGPLLHRAGAEVAGDGRLGAAVRGTDERRQGALWRHRGHARDLPRRRGAELSRARTGVRDRAQHRLARHPEHVGLHRGLPDEAASCRRSR